MWLPEKILLCYEQGVSLGECITKQRTHSSEFGGHDRKIPGDYTFHSVFRACFILYAAIRSAMEVTIMMIPLIMHSS